MRVQTRTLDALLSLAWQEQLPPPHVLLTEILSPPRTMARRNSNNNDGGPAVPNYARGQRMSFRLPGPGWRSDYCCRP